MSQMGSFSEVDARIGEVCFAPVNGLRQSGLSGPKSATSGLMHCSKRRCYSIISAEGLQIAPAAWILARIHSLA
jgi:hypothetical protein